MIKDKDKEGLNSWYKFVKDRGLDARFNEAEVNFIKDIQRRILQSRNYSPILYSDVRKEASHLAHKFAIEAALGDLVHQGKLKEVEWVVGRGSQRKWKQKAWDKV